MALPALHAAICMRRFSVCQLLQWSWGGEGGYVFSCVLCAALIRPPALRQLT